jgi:hypothetical protein
MVQVRFTQSVIEYSLDTSPEKYSMADYMKWIIVRSKYDIVQTALRGL